LEGPVEQTGETIAGFGELLADDRHGLRRVVVADGNAQSGDFGVLGGADGLVGQSRGGGLDWNARLQIAVGDGERVTSQAHSGTSAFDSL